MKLSPDDVSFPKGKIMNVRFRRGKTASKSGQYTIAQPLPSQATQDWVEMANRENQLWLFPGVETADLTAHLRSINPQLECRSLRRGRLQYLSQIGYGDEELLHVSRHAGLPMLRRYLTFGSDSGENRRQAMRITELGQKQEQLNVSPRHLRVSAKLRHHPEGLPRPQPVAATTVPTSCKGCYADQRRRTPPTTHAKKASKTSRTLPPPSS